MVVSAPTGSGKTVLFELAIIKLLLDVDNGVYGNIDDIKAVYSKYCPRGPHTRLLGRKSYSFGIPEAGNCCIQLDNVVGSSL